MAKRLVICADGTWNEPAPKVDGKLTNVFELACSVVAQTAGAVPRLVYYHPGVGSELARTDAAIASGTTWQGDYIRPVPGETGIDASVKRRMGDPARTQLRG
jgi:hypothetical protein